MRACSLISFFFFVFFYTWEHCLVVCAFSAFSTTGFERQASLVFNPAKPESSVEDCLAAMGDRVAGELDTSLAAAIETLLPGSANLVCACEKSGALWNTHVCKNVFPQQQIQEVWKENICPRSRNVNVDIVLLASFSSSWTLKRAGVVWNFGKMKLTCSHNFNRNMTLSLKYFPHVGRRCWECKLAIVHVKEPSQFHVKAPSSNQDAPWTLVCKSDKTIIALDTCSWADWQRITFHICLNALMWSCVPDP